MAREAGAWMVSAVISSAVLLTGCGGSGSAGEASPVSTTATRPAASIPTAPLTPHDPSRVRPEEQTAIVRLGQSGAGEPVDAHGHDHHGPSIEMPLSPDEAAAFDDQWLAARSAVQGLDTIEEIEAQGYVRASAPASGIGTHWVKWSQIAQPFDPRHPAMLLVDERGGAPRLVGFSYWVQSPTQPEGFAGPNDVWHQHAGLCVVNGWVDREEVPGPEQCAGTWLAGSDLWMLHAWVVPGYENLDGRFAQHNPKLCPPAAGTPDLLRCPES